MDTHEINKDRKQITVNFAKKNGVILVLKGPETLVIDAKGQIFENHSGNCCLARAGSGDVLTGMIAGLCSLYDDPYQAVQDAVDGARAEGADYVVVMAHMGNEAEVSPWMYTDVISHTSGIDAWLDGHSHDAEQVVMKNKDDEDV